MNLEKRSKKKEYAEKQKKTRNPLSKVLTFLLALVILLSGVSIVPSAVYAGATRNEALAKYHNPNGTDTLTTLTGLTRSSFVNYMNNNKNKYIGRGYGVTGNKMTCAKFVSTAVRDAGGRLSGVNDSIVRSFDEWTSGMKRYVFGSKDAMLKSGILQKGDIITFHAAEYVGAYNSNYLYSGKDAFGNVNDAHIGIFWGDSSNGDKL